MEASDELIQQRLTKLKNLRKSGRDPYAPSYDRSALIGEVLATFSPGGKAKVSGRLMAWREHGKSIFGDLRDATGSIQLFFSKDRLPDSFEALSMLDMGDIVGVSGELFKTRTGERTLKVDDWQMISKCVRPLPEKWHGLKNVELRYRQRYLDFMFSPETRKVFETRSQLISGIRRFLEKRNFVEVETPMMQSVPGGAVAKPFKTHHAALKRDLFLRIAPELYLKMLLVAGMDRVFELNRNFRNEGISTRHNPEFTMLEVYQAYSDVQGMRLLTEELISQLVKELYKKDEITFQEKKISFKQPWKQAGFFELLKKETGADCQKEATARAQAKKAGLASGKEVALPHVWDKLFEKTVQPKLVAPTFVLDYPIELCPLSKANPKDPKLADRFELFVAGVEIANAYSELNDAEEQRKRFKEQVKKRPKGKDQEFFADDDFVKALEYGMPPAGGLGIGIDRLVMLLTDSASIREVILFPMLRAETEDGS